MFPDPLRPLARNQYINNSPEVFSCARAGANTGAACISPEWTPQAFGKIFGKCFLKKCPVLARVQIQAPHAFMQWLIPQDSFSARIGSVPEGNCGPPSMDWTRNIFWGKKFPLRLREGAGLSDANAKSQCFSYAISEIAPLHPVVALNRSFESQTAARYAVFWHAAP